MREGRVSPNKAFEKYAWNIVGDGGERKYCSNRRGERKGDINCPTMGPMVVEAERAQDVGTLVAEKFLPLRSQPQFQKSSVQVDQLQAGCCLALDSGQTSQSDRTGIGSLGRTMRKEKQPAPPVLL